MTLNRYKLGRALLFAAALAVTGLAGCADDSHGEGAGTDPGSSATPPGLGAVSVDLKVGSAIRLAAVNYEITRQGFAKLGSFDVSDSSIVSGIVPGLPAATGYTIALTAGDTTGLLSGCQGSAPFDVTAGATTSVTVHLTCREMTTTTTIPPPAVPIPPAVPLALAVALAAVGVIALRNGHRNRGR